MMKEAAALREKYKLTGRKIRVFTSVKPKTPKPGKIQ